MTAESNAATLPQEDESLEAADSTFKAALGATMTLIALTVVWELLVRQFQVPAWLLPSPSLIGQSMVEWRSELVGHSMVTLYETLVGFVLAIAISIPLAVAVVYSPLLQNTIYPILLALQSMPKVAIAPLLALWIGFGTLPKIVVVFLVCFFHRRDCERSRCSAGSADGPDPVLVGKLSADLRQDPLPDRHAAHLRGPQDRHHFRGHRRGNR
jgi:ABC-type anion transport system duplicated permease subunit